MTKVAIGQIWRATQSGTDQTTLRSFRTYSHAIPDGVDFYPQIQIGDKIIIKNIDIPTYTDKFILVYIVHNGTEYRIMSDLLYDCFTLDDPDTHEVVI